MIDAQRINLELGFVLHSKPYRDTSLLVEAFTRNYGRIGLAAKGVRSNNSRYAGLLQPFSPLLFSWSGKRELHTLTSLEAAGAARSIAGKRLFSGFYLNELIIKLLQRGDAYPALFDSYMLTLEVLETKGEEQAALRRFEYILLREMGYGLVLDHDVETGEPLQPDMEYCYYIDRGPVAKQSSSGGGCLLVRGKTLLAINGNDLKDEDSLKEAKRLMRAVLNVHLDYRPLKSRELYWQSKYL